MTVFIVIIYLFIFLIICSFSQQIFQEPVSCKSGHTFCLLCIWEWLRTRNKCPLDNVALAEQDLVQNLAIRGIVENLEVSCHNDDQSDEVWDLNQPRNHEEKMVSEER